jgi:hypothetical protein
MTDEATMRVSLSNNDGNAPVSQPKPVRFLAHIISFVFHPLFIPTYIAAFLIFIDPYAFAAAGESQKAFKLISVFSLTAFFPAFSVLLMRLLKFIDTIYLRTQRDRIIPYIASMVYYFWAWHVFRNLHESPAIVAMLLGTFVSCIAASMANIYFKISMHSIAVGALFIFFGWLAFHSAIPIGTYLAAATLVTGLVCTARFIVSNHSPFEIYAGLLAGALCQGVAILIAA